MKIEKSEYTEEQGTVLEDGERYPAVLTGFGEMDGQYGKRLVWQWDVDNEGESVEAAAFTSYSMAEKPRKSNLLKFSEAMVGGDPEGMDLEDLLGKPAMVEIETYTKQNGITKNKVVDVKKPKKGQKGRDIEKPQQSAGASAGGSDKSDEVTFDESDFDDIPLRHLSRRNKVIEGIL